MIIVDPLEIPSPFNIGSHVMTSSNVGESDFTNFGDAALIAVGDKRQVVDPGEAVSISAASPAVFSAWVGNPIDTGTQVRLTTTGTLPTGLTAGEIYYVRDFNAAGTFSVSAKPGGEAVNTSASGSGVHTATLNLHNVYEAVGVGVDCNINGTPPTTTITVNTVSSGVITVGMVLSHATNFVATGNRVLEILTGGGGAGQLLMSVSQTITAGAGYRFTAPPTDTDFWIFHSHTNRWKMHDDSGASQTARVTDITNEYTVDGVVDSVVLLGIDAATVQVKATDGTAGLVYNTTKTTESVSAITGLTERHSAVTFLDLPTAYTDLVIDVILTATGETVLCGSCGIGKSLDYGGTLYGLRMGIEDFSVKAVDDFGVVTITPRGHSKEMTLTSLISNDDIDVLFQKLISFKSIAVFFIGDNSRRSTIVYGFYNDFNIEISYPENSLVSIDIEGLV